MRSNRDGSLVAKKHVLDNCRTTLDFKTKIICTLGPSSRTVEQLENLLQTGMSVARFNFSHGTHEYHLECLNNLRQACMNTGKVCAVLLDTKGPEIRTGTLEDGKPVTLERGKELTLTTDYSVVGNKDLLAVSYQWMARDVKAGDNILMADGSVMLEVMATDVDAGTVRVKCLNSATIGERKNCNLPGVAVDLPTLTEKDLHDIIGFGVVHDVDFIAASFVRKGSDVLKIRDVLDNAGGSSIRIISKVENHEGLCNYDDILRLSDGIMVARGDLGMEIPSEKVFLAQKMMISRCNLAGKPVVTATQMLESMTGVPRPTRAEAGDVANAVLDGTDCVMLSGETAAGGYPLNAVTIMRRICEEAEGVCAYGSLYQSMRSRTLERNGEMSSVESICSSAVKSTIDANCKLIIALTETGSTARCIAKYRPAVPILAISASETTVRQLLTVRGVIPTLTASFVGTDAVIKKALDKAKADGMVKAGDVVVAIHGQREECPGHSNLLKMVVVP